MKAVLSVATWQWEMWTDCVCSWVKTAAIIDTVHWTRNKDVIDAYQMLYLKAEGYDIIGYVHDDLVCKEYGWDTRILAEFEDPTVGLVGIAGALGHGAPEMYTVPYKLPQLARRGFMSNLENAEHHGERFTGKRTVTVLDGMALFVRRRALEEFGGWPVGRSPIGYYLYSEWLCCMMRRHGWKIRLVGIAVDHLGGKSTGLNKTGKFDFEGEHFWLYQKFKDVLPAEVPR